MGTNKAMVVDISKQIIFYVSKDDKIMKCDKTMNIDSHNFVFLTKNDQITGMKLSFN